MIDLFNKYHKNRKKLDIVHLWFGLCVWLNGEMQNNEGPFGTSKTVLGLALFPHTRTSSELGALCKCPFSVCENARDSLPVLY